MRRMARDFSARKTDRERVTRELRLLTQPIYRYKSTDPKLLDGAMFAFVEGTDPEVLLLIEARQANGGARWQYALARMNSVALQTFYKKREIWKAPQLTPPWSNLLDRTKPYTYFSEEVAEPKAGECQIA